MPYDPITRSHTNLKMPEKHARVLTDSSKPWRFRVLYGGRGGAKDWSIVRWILEMCIRTPKRVLFTREIQVTIQTSIKQLLEDQIKDMHYESFYTVVNNEIRGSNGSLFTFKGLRDLNADQLKSLEGYDICVIIEAQSLSKKSFDLIDPTIRKANSEIWIDFNTQYEDDFVYQRFVVNTPTNCIIELVSVFDNPWRTKELMASYELDKVEQHPDFQNKWHGAPLKMGGRIYPMFKNTENPDGHIRTFDWERLRDYGNCICAMDPHSHYYPAIVWIAVFPKNLRMHWPEDFYKYIYNEWPTRKVMGGDYADLRSSLQADHLTLLEQAKEILHFDQAPEDGNPMGLRIMARVMDPRFAKGAGSWDYTSKTEGIVAAMRKPENGGLEFSLPKTKILDGQREIIKNDLKWNIVTERSMWNEPTLYVAPWCHNVIQTLAHHRLRDGTAVEDDKYKDFSDAIRIGYAALDGWDYVSPITMNRPAATVNPITQWNIQTGTQIPKNVGWMM